MSNFLFKQTHLVFVPVYIRSGVLICTAVQLRTIWPAFSQSQGSNYVSHIINTFLVDAICFYVIKQIIKKTNENGANFHTDSGKPVD